MILKLGMQHQLLEYHPVDLNDDPGLNLTFLRQCQFSSLKRLYENIF